MKRGMCLKIIVLLFWIPVTLWASFFPISYNDSIQSVYVWDFTVSKPSIKEIGKMLTEDFETELIKLHFYKVLERRKYHRVLAHQNMENQVSEVQNLTAATKSRLMDNHADVVIFGLVRDDINSGEYEVTVTFQNLNNEEILRKEKVLIKRGLISDNTTRTKHMKDLVELLHSRELMAHKKQQYEIASQLLNTYLIRVENLRKEFEDMAQYALNDEKYMGEINKTVLEYNTIFNDLNDNENKYLMDFSEQWGNNRGREFKSIYAEIMEDIHKMEVLKLDKTRRDIALYNQSKLGKSEKEKLKNRIMMNVMETTDDMRRKIGMLETNIQRFLQPLSDEISD